MKVGFVIAGAQKGGTTALASFLAQHPQVCISNPKEVHFFDNDRLFEGPGLPEEEYHRHFLPTATTLLLGEATPIYMYWKPAAARIRAYNAEMKWILLLRNPVERAYSHYMMERNRGYESLPFSEAIRAESVRVQESYPLQHRIYSYIDRGRYTNQIERILTLFNREQLLFLRSEDLRFQHGAVLKKVFNFLGVEDSVKIEQALVFDQHYVPMANEDRTFLLNALLPEMDRLEVLLGWDCSAWKK
jgi:hypothetical protein